MSCVNHCRYWPRTCVDEPIHASTDSSSSLHLPIWEASLISLYRRPIQHLLETALPQLPPAAALPPWSVCSIQLKHAKWMMSVPASATPNTQTSIETSEILLSGLPLGCLDHCWMNTDSCSYVQSSCCESIPNPNFAVSTNEEKMWRCLIFFLIEHTTI